MPWLLASALAAQTPPDPAPAKPATAAERLAALEAEQKKIVADWTASMRDAQQKAKEAKDAGQPVPAMPMRPDFAPLLGQAKAAAAEFAGSDDAVPFLLFVVQNAMNQREDLAAALDTLTDKHVAHPRLAELGSMIGVFGRILPKEKADLFTARLEQSANVDVRGWALLARLGATVEKGDRDGEPYQAAKKELLAAADLATDQRLQSEIRSAIDTREKFGIGNVAPDITGPDLDGVEFKLSDYHGKVVFLDFWGDW